MLTEVARFRPDDPDPLVQASFACSVCLREPTIATVDHETEGTAAVCRCDACSRTWMVFMSPEQSLRLRLRPPWPGMATVLRRR